MSAYRDALSRALDALPDEPGPTVEDECAACRTLIAAMVGALRSVDPDLARRLAMTTLPHLEEP